MRVSIYLLLLLFVWPLVSGAVTITEDFENGFNGWNWQWDDMGGGRVSTASITQLNGYNDFSSVRMEIDGRSDTGILWIEKRFAIPANSSDSVDVSFELYNSDYSDFNRWNVMTYIGENNPEEFGVFYKIGETNTQTGWTNFQFASPSFVGSTGDLWVAFGIWATWETNRTFDIDHVKVSATLIPEPSTILLIGTGLIGIGSLRRKGSRKRRVNFLKITEKAEKSGARQAFLSA